MAKYFKISTRAFTLKYCEKDSGHFQLKESSERADCLFLANKRCSVYEARPTQCRTWPFWPEVMNAKTWAKEVASFCPGVGKGQIVSAERIQEILTEDHKSTQNL
jgi:uncharacterized protein